MSTARFGEIRALAAAAVATAAATLMAAGCATDPRPMAVQCQSPSIVSAEGPALVGRRHGMAMTPIALDNVQFGSAAVAGSVAVQDLHVSRMPGNSVEVAARFVSCLDTPSSVRVRTSFLRADSAPVGPASAWRTVFLAPRATAVYSEVSTSADVASYLIEVQP